MVLIEEEDLAEPRPWFLIPVVGLFAAAIALLSIMKDHEAQAVLDRRLARLQTVEAASPRVDVTDLAFNSVALTPARVLRETSIGPRTPLRPVIDAVDVIRLDDEDQHGSGTYALALRSIIEENHAGIPVGYKRILIEADVSNLAGVPAPIYSTSFSLVQSGPDRHYAALADIAVKPELVGLLLAAGQTFRGFVGFDVPVDVPIDDFFIDLCLGSVAPCQFPLRISMPGDEGD